jgi:hypothetical protein
MEKALQKYRDEYVSKSRSIVTCTPPTEFETDLTDAVGIVKEIIIVDNTVIGELHLFKLPKAESVEEAINSGKLHMRTAGIGKMTEQADGTFKIEDGYEIISCFLTDDPA